MKRSRILENNRKHILVAALLLVLISFLALLFMRSSYFQVDKIKVTGSSYYTDKEVITMADAKVGGNIFFGVDTGDIMSRLEKNPYFKSVKVKRRLPKTLEIVVDPRTQIGAFAYGDQYVVVDSEGIVLRKTGVEPKVTVINGLNISKMELGKEVEVEEKDGLSTALHFLNTMRQGNLYFKSVYFQKLMVKAYIYDSLYAKGTVKEVENSIKNGQLQKVIANLLQDGISRGAISIGSNDYMSFSPETN